MNSKLTLIASLFVAAFSEDKTDSIEVQTLRALSQMCDIKISRHSILINANDPDDDMDYAIEISNAADGNICVEAQQSDDVLFDSYELPRQRTVVFDNSTDALYFVSAVIGQFDLHVELRPNSKPPISDHNNIEELKRDCDEDEDFAEEERDFLPDEDDEDDDSIERMALDLDAKDKNRESWDRIEREEENRKRSAWYDKYSQRPSFNRMLDDLGITRGMDKQTTIATIASVEFECLTQFFDKYVVDIDLSELDWDDGFDIIAAVMNEPRFERINKRNTLVKRLTKWVGL
jgi:hypothetical protein